MLGKTAQRSAARGTVFEPQPFKPADNPAMAEPSVKKSIYGSTPTESVIVTIEGTKITRLLVISGIVVLLDQVTKTLIAHYLQLYHTIAVIPGFFNLTHIHNPGGAFGFLAQSDPILRKVVFIFVSLLAVGLILWYYMKTPVSYPLLGGAFALIFGGAIGNLIDRIRLGKVIDFLDFYIGNLHWPAFNIADSAITIGIGIFILHLLFKKLPE